MCFTIVSFKNPVTFKNLLLDCTVVPKELSQRKTEVQYSLKEINKSRLDLMGFSQL